MVRERTEKSRTQEDSRDFTSVLANLRDINGDRVGDEIIDKVAREKKRLVLIGEPSGGKTTLVANIAYELERKAMAVQSFVFYDQVLRTVEGLIEGDKPHLKSRDMWSEEEWSKLDNALIDAIGRTEGKRAIVEVPGVSDKYGIRTRGKNAIRDIVAGSDDILVVYNVADPSTQMWGAHVRETLQNTEDQDVFKVLEEDFRAQIVGIEGTTQEGALLKEAVRWAAAREHIDAIDVEMMEMARKWMLQDNNSNKMDEVRITIEENSYDEIVGGSIANSEGQAKKFAESVEFKVKLKAAFAKDYVQTELGLEESQSMIVFNPYRKDLRILIDMRVFGIGR